MKYLPNIIANSFNGSAVPQKVMIMSTRLQKFPNNNSIR